MRNALKLLAAAITVLAAMSFGAASAHGVLIVTNEGTGAECSKPTTSGTSVSNGCLIHFSSLGTIEIRKHVFGVESHITNCTMELYSRLGSGSLGPPVQEATGYFLEQDLSGLNCSRQGCKPSSESNPWEYRLTETAGTITLTTNICVEPKGGGTDENCEIDIPFTPLADHGYRIGMAGEMPSHGITGFRCELVGLFDNEVSGTHDAVSVVTVEITHMS